MTKKVIYNTKYVAEGWSLKTYSAELLTWIEEIQFLWIKWYRIRQNIPYIKNPCYDGEYSTNIIFEHLASDEKTKAKLWLINYKNNKNDVTDKG